MNHIAPVAEPAIRDIPLCRLALAPENVRKTPPDEFAQAQPRSRTEGFDELVEVDRRLVRSALANATARHARLERATAVSRPTAGIALGVSVRRSRGIVRPAGEVGDHSRSVC